MTLKELAGVCEAAYAMHNTEEILGIYVSNHHDFPEIHIREEEYIKHFGNTLPEPHSEAHDKMRTTWSGAEVFCLIDKEV